MKNKKNRADPERFFPKGESSIEGCLKKMSYLRSNTEIQVAVPLKSQIFSLIQRSAEGLTVQEISAKLALNTKTCAKVLDEMIFKHNELKATAHRYGRVFVHKYHVITNNLITTPVVQPDLFAELPESILTEIREVESSIGETIKSAISQSLKEEKKHSRQRITDQSYLRALFVVARVRKLKVVSVYDVKEMIRNELEPNAKWCLDKKTVLRIIWKLRNCGLVKELCFRIRLRKDDDHEVQFLGSHYDSILEDKRSNRNSAVIYKLLAAVTELAPDDPLVLDCPAIKNPTNRKPFPSSSSLTKPVINIKSKLIREIALVQNSAYKKAKSLGSVDDVVQGIQVMQKIIEDLNVELKDDGSPKVLARAYSLAIFVKSLFKLLETRVFDRYNFLFSTFRMPLCYTALKEFLNRPGKTIDDKYSLAYSSVVLEKKKTDPLSPNESVIKAFPTISLPKKRKHTLDEMTGQIQKIFLTIEKKPESVSDETLRKIGKGIDTDPVYLFEYLSDLGYANKRGDYWEVSFLI